MVATPTRDKDVEIQTYRFETELTELLEAVRVSSEDALFAPSSKSFFGPFLEGTPLRDCLRIDQLWLDAIHLGLPIERIEPRLTLEHQYILRFVLAIFSGIEPRDYNDCPSTLDMPIPRA